MEKITLFIGGMVLIAYKGFNFDWTCQGFQYEVGNTYIHSGQLILKKAGFHSAPNPMYILNHYQPCNEAKFALVDIRGEILDYKEIYISSKITIMKELTFFDMVKYWLNKNPDLFQLDSENQSFVDIAKKHNLTDVYILLNRKITEIS